MVAKSRKVLKFDSLISIAVVIGTGLACVINSVECRTPHRSCGRFLVSRVSVICKGYYNTFPTSRPKRAIIEDCCHRICSDDDIRKNYCLNDNNSKEKNGEEQPEIPPFLFPAMEVHQLDTISETTSKSPKVEPKIEPQTTLSPNPKNLVVGRVPEEFLITSYHVLG